MKLTLEVDTDNVSEVQTAIQTLRLFLPKPDGQRFREPRGDRQILIMAFLRDLGRPATNGDIRACLELTGPNASAKISAALRALAARDLVKKVKHGVWSLTDL